VWQLLSVNLRNHRKILVVTARPALPRMNLRVGHWLEKKPRSPVQDISFDWKARWWPSCRRCLPTIGVHDRELLRGEKWFPPLGSAGPSSRAGSRMGRRDFDKLRWVLLSALASRANRSGSPRLIFCRTRA